MLRSLAAAASKSVYSASEVPVVRGAVIGCSSTESHADTSQRWIRLAAAVAGATALSLGTAVADRANDVELSAASGTRKNPLLLYQYEVCPWCNKVKAVLDYHSVPYRAIEVNPVTKAQLSFSEYKKVPVLVAPSGEQVNDSAQIIESIHSQFVKSKRGWFGGKTGVQEPQEITKWRSWSDTTLVQLVTLNVYKTTAESFQTMEYIKHVDSFSTIEQTAVYFVGALMMYGIGNFVLPKKYGYTGKDLREELCKEVNSFVAAVGKRDFIGGKTPSLADLQVFGVIRAISATDTFQFMMTETDILPWWRRMVDAVGESSRVEDLPDSQ